MAKKNPGSQEPQEGDIELGALTGNPNTPEDTVGREKTRDGKVIASREKKRDGKSFVLAKAIISANNPGQDTEGLQSAYAQHYQKMDNLVSSDIFSPRAFKLDLVKPELISIPYLERYFKTVIGSFTDFNKEGIEDGYDREPKKWLHSAANRGRLVLVEATDENLKQIADAMINASPLERVVAVGLDSEKQRALKKELLRSWKEKIAQQEEPQEYKAGLLDALQQEENNSTVALLKDFTLESLMGPHAFTEEKDISYAYMQDQLDASFSSKLDEIVLYGDQNSLAQELPHLAMGAGAGRYLAIKAGEFNDESATQWTARFTNETDPLALLTSSKDPSSILKEDRTGENEGASKKGILGKAVDVVWPGFDVETIPSSEKNYELNPKFEQLLDSLGEKYELDEKDVDYLKKLSTSQSLYPPNLSPGLYSSTITKTQSGINGEGAVVVGNALREGNIGRQVATAKGVLFAVNATMFDTANDINLEAQEKNIIYKDLLQQLLAHYGGKSEMDKEQVYEKAMEGLFHAYTLTEKNPNIIKNQKEGELLRTYTLENANQTNRRNRLGINLLLPSPVGVLYGAGATVAGMTLAATGANSSIAFPITGAAVFTTFTTILATSLELQRTANADNLARWHRSSARAHHEFRTALDNRKKLVQNWLEETLNPTQGQDMGNPLAQSKTASIAPGQEAGLGVPESKPMTEVGLAILEKKSDTGSTSSEEEEMSPVMAQPKTPRSPRDLSALTKAGGNPDTSPDLTTVQERKPQRPTTKTLRKSS